MSSAQILMAIALVSEVPGCIMVITAKRNVSLLYKIIATSLVALGIGLGIVAWNIN